MSAVSKEHTEYITFREHLSEVSKAHTSSRISELEYNRLRTMKNSLISRARTLSLKKEGA